jgi:hypothetical protein
VFEVPSVTAAIVNLLFGPSNPWWEMPPWVPPVKV